MGLGREGSSGQVRVQWRGRTAPAARALSRTYIHYYMSLHTLYSYIRGAYIVTPDGLHWPHLIGSLESNGYAEMREIPKRTGGKGRGGYEDGANHLLFFWTKPLPSFFFIISYTFPTFVTKSDTPNHCHSSARGPSTAKPRPARGSVSEYILSAGKARDAASRSPATSTGKGSLRLPAQVGWRSIC